jgi:hypothetical protein
LVFLGDKTGEVMRWLSVAVKDARPGQAVLILEKGF